MDNHHLRSILLNLQYRLSDNDRERLHFYLKNDVPRTLGDDSTLNGTLRLMQSLFDQDKISERDFTLLIDAFKQIQCFDAVNLLKEHQRRMLLSGLNQSTQSLASMMPSLIEEFINDYEDERQDATDNFVLNQINYSNNNNNNMIDSNNITINENTKRKWSCIPSLTNKYFLLIFILFILTLAILIVVLIEGNTRINNLKDNLQVKQNYMYILETKNQNNQTVKQLNSLSSENNETIQQLNKIKIELENQNNQTVKQLNNVLSEKNAVIEQLNKILTELNKQNNQTIKQLKDQLLEKNATIEHLNTTLIEIQQGRKTLLIKAGRKFGGDGGADFDDSSLPMFTFSYYLSGFVFSDIENFDACQFIYTSAHDNQSRIESNNYGLHEGAIGSPHEYHLDDDERIEQVKVKSYHKQFGSDGTITIAKLIRGLQFVTTKGRIIPPSIPLKGYQVEFESFLGYTLGYVTGKSGTKIDQLQFFWYRTKQ